MVGLQPRVASVCPLLRRLPRAPLRTPQPLEDGGQRRFFGDRHWRQPLAWNRAAEGTGKPLKVFCASMADVFEEHEELDPWRERLWGLIEETPGYSGSY